MKKVSWELSVIHLLQCLVKVTSYNCAELVCPEISLIQEVIEVIVSITMGFAKHQIDGSGHLLYNDSFMKRYLVRFDRPKLEYTLVSNASLL